MAEFKCKRREQLANSKKLIHKSSQYKQAITYADDTLKEELEGYANTIVLRFKRFVKRSSIILASVVIVSIISFFILKEKAYSSCIRDFYAQKITANEAYKQLSESFGYREPDECTKFLINKAEPGSYPSNETLTSITIPDGVTEIYNSAFKGCTNLTSITIPDSVTTIGNNAFADCTNLTSITIPDSVTTIGNNAFSRCHGIISLVIPEGVTSIGNRAFYYCKNLTSITIPDSVITIGSSAFDDCANLTSITIPDSVTKIGYSAFYGCVRLKSVKIPNSMTSINDLTFGHCISLTSITIPDSLISIDDSAFDGCLYIEEVCFQSEAQMNKFKDFYYFKNAKLIVK